MTNHRPGGEFLLFARNTLLGQSQLEWEDAAEGVWLRAGLFIPAETYFQFQHLFQNHTRELMAARLAQHPYNRTALERSSAQIESLQLRLLHPDGTEIPVTSLELQDCADTLSEEPRELQVEIRDRIIHDRYFSQPTA